MIYYVKDRFSLTQIYDCARNYKRGQLKINK